MTNEKGDKTFVESGMFFADPGVFDMFSWKLTSGFREKQLLDSTFERSFHGWTDKDWDAFQTTYVKSVS